MLMLTKQNLKRIKAIILILVMVFTMFPSTISHAASVKNVSMSFGQCIDSKGNIIRWQQNVYHNNTLLEETGKIRTRIYADGKSAFCIQPGYPLNTGNILESNASSAWKSLSVNQRKAVNIALLYGLQGNKANLSGTDDEKWVATQIIVWEIVTGCRKPTGDYECKNDKFYKGMCGGGNSGVATVYRQIATAMATHNTIPSFSSSDKSITPTEYLKWDGNKYTLTLKDTNKILSKFKFTSTDDDIKVNTSGNALTITADKEFTNTVTLSAQKKIPTVSSSAALVAYGHPTMQDVVVGVENASDINAYIKVKIPYGHCKLKKTSEDGIVSGIKFTVEGNGIKKTVTTGTDGTFNIALPTGTYTITEQSIDRYAPLSSKKITITENKTTTVAFSNKLKKFRVIVKKTDLETGKPQGDGTLDKAVYGIYKGKELVDTYTTHNGQFTTKYYTCGNDWTVREISPSEGYLLDAKSYHVGAEAKLYTVEYNTTTNVVNEQVIKGNIAIIKHTDNGDTQIETPEKGAVFEVFLKSAGDYDKAKKSARDILTCDENGFAQTKDLPYGTYTVRQTFGWEGRELMKPFDVIVNADGHTYPYIINNSYFESHIKIVKKDAETGKTIPYAGAGFQIFDPEGKLITMTYTYPEITTIDTFYTTANGELVTPQTLEVGKGYSIVEVQAPYGYVLNSNPIYFDITQENSKNESGITVIEVIRPNMAQKGRITISKSGEILSSVSQVDGVYQPVYTSQKLEGATYEISAAEDIYTQDGTLRAAKGEIVDTLTTNAEGAAQSFALYLGRYEVKETAAPDGMILDKESHLVELAYAGQEIEVTETTVNLSNERQKAEIELHKKLAVDNTYGIGKNKEISDVTFGLYASQNIIADDNTKIPKDGLIEIITPDENGYGKIRSDLPFGDYYVKEISTNNSYIISDKKYPITFKYAGQKQESVKITVNEGTILNEIIYGSVEGKKVDEKGRGLKGALIGIFKPGTSKYTSESAITTTASAYDGSFYFAKVPYGKWIIREIKSPKGFVLSEKAIPVMIGQVDETVKIELVNKPIKKKSNKPKMLGNTPKTGDDTKIWSWVSLALASFAGIVICIKVCRKKWAKKEETEKMEG